MDEAHRVMDMPVAAPVLTSGIDVVIVMRHQCLSPLPVYEASLIPSCHIHSNSSEQQEDLENVKRPRDHDSQRGWPFIWL